MYPALWFGFLSLFIVQSMISGAAWQNAMWVFVPLALIMFGYFMMKRTLWDLMDKVIDYGDYLTVTYKGENDTVRVSNIADVKISTYKKPMRVILHLKTPGKFGRELAFIPGRPPGFNPLRRDTFINDLIQRVQATGAQKPD